MTLHQELVAKIALNGPLSVAEFMHDCLLHPRYGYYTSRDPFGAAGDFITAPEISQMFGELLGLCLAQSWLDQGGGPMHLVELGPGRGTLMADMLRAMRSVPDLTPQPHLVEASPKLRDLQRQTLGTKATWHNDVTTLPEGPLFLVANEFFDALAVRQFIRQGRGWAERCIGAAGDTLQFGLRPPVPMQDLAHRLADTKDGDLVELRPAATPIIEAISTQIAQHGGAALIIDYGDWSSLGDTLQAMRGHRHADPLDAPGEADLTAHVDFAALTAASRCAVSKMMTQADLLFALGIGPRAEALANVLAERGDEVALRAHLDAFQRLTQPAQMGTLFKALALYPEGAPPPPGFHT